MVGLGEKLRDITLGEALVAIVIGWILVAIWQRFIDNFMYNKLGLEKSDSFDTLIVALVVTAIFISFIAIFGLVSYTAGNADFGPI